MVVVKNEMPGYANGYRLAKKRFIAFLCDLCETFGLTPAEIRSSYESLVKLDFIVDEATSKRSLPIFYSYANQPRYQPRAAKLLSKCDLMKLARFSL